MEFRNILLPVSGTEADDEAMRLACMLAKKSKAKIYAVYVIAIKRSLPLEAEVESAFTKALEPIVSEGVGHYAAGTEVFRDP